MRRRLQIRRPQTTRHWLSVALVALLFAGVGATLVYQSRASQELPADINSDGIVNMQDLSILFTNWGRTGPATPGTPPTPPTPPGTPPPTSGTICPAAGSGEAIPTANTGKFKLLFADDFCVNAPLGSWGSECESSKVVYTGNGPTGATKWTAYPKCFKDTYQKRPYRSDAVLSVHDGVLDFHMHPVDGQPAGANPSPLIDGTSKYQTYGRYAARFKVDTPGLSDYHLAWLLWPSSDSDGACAESDYPEGDAAGNASAFHHNDPGCSDYTVQDHFSSGVSFTSGWHTYVQEWEPGVRRYYVDGRLIGTSTTRVFSKPQRWQLQTETSTSSPNNKSGHLLLDWAVVWKYQP